MKLQGIYIFQEEEVKDWCDCMKRIFKSNLQEKDE